MDRLKAGLCPRMTETYRWLPPPREPERPRASGRGLSTLKLAESRG